MYSSQAPYPCGDGLGLSGAGCEDDVRCGIRASGALFVRKCSRQVDGALFDVLPVEAHELLPNIGWRTDGGNIDLLPASQMNLRYVRCVSFHSVSVSPSLRRGGASGEDVTRAL